MCRYAIFVFKVSPYFSLSTLPFKLILFGLALLGRLDDDNVCTFVEVEAAYSRYFSVFRGRIL